MADLDENLIVVLAADSGVSAITTTIAVNAQPESESQPYIWIQLDDEQEDLDMDGVGGAVQSFFDIECTATNLDNAKDLQAAVKAALNGKTGTFGDQNIAYAEVTSRDDTYETRQDFGDSDNLHVAALTLELGTDSR